MYCPSLHRVACSHLSSRCVSTVSFSSADPGLYILSLLPLSLCYYKIRYPGSINSRWFLFCFQRYRQGYRYEIFKGYRYSRYRYEQVAAVPKYIFDCCCPLRKEHTAKSYLLLPSYLLCNRFELLVFLSAVVDTLLLVGC